MPKKEYYENLDMAFVLPYNSHHESENIIRVGLNISGLYGIGGYNQKTCLT